MRSSSTDILIPLAPFAVSRMSAANELIVQSEKAFQKQPIFTNSKAARKVSKQQRWFKDVGLGIKTPQAAINGTYIDKKDPWVGQVSIRGRILSGRVVSTKMQRTIVIRREYLNFGESAVLFLLGVGHESN